MQNNNHGVRKYEPETGRFTTPDPLWSSYLGWTPYQYSLNSPIFSLDFTGKAQYILNGGTILNDNINDGLLYASDAIAFNSSIVESFDGGPGIDFTNLRQSSYLLPHRDIMQEILSSHISRPVGEGGGVGGYNNFYYGGRNETKFPPSASTEVIKSIRMAGKSGDILNITYYTHDHPFTNSFGDITKDITPTEPVDRDAIHNLYFMGAKNIRFGILFNLDKVNIFGINEFQDIIFDRQILEDYAW